MCPAARRAVAALVTLLFLTGAATTASADTRTQLSAAQRRLTALEAQISREQSLVVSFQASLKSLAAAAVHSRGVYEAIQAGLAQARLLGRRLEAGYRPILGAGGWSAVG